jgi:hypothetical protein
MRDPYIILNEWLYGDPKGNFTESRNANSPESGTTDTQKLTKISNIHRYERPNKRRVVIHMKFQKNKEKCEQLGKLMFLPDSLEELFSIAGKSLS